MHPPRFEEWFESVTGYAPRPWQVRLGSDPALRSRLVRAPTGAGKTLAVVLAWAYHRLVVRDPTWPRRLVFVLPMRVLVEQCTHEIRTVLARITQLSADGRAEVQVHTLMGGIEANPWHLQIEREAVLVGTQDMLISRALNRGYAAPRARWPMEYGLLHQDVLWVLDEVQLMGVGFATTAQLQAFRDALAEKALRSGHSWWMSATLQPSWLERTALADSIARLDADAVRVPPAERTGGPFSATKPMRVVALPKARDAKQVEWAKAVHSAHVEATAGEHGRITLAICNTVDDAMGVYAALRKLAGKGSATELRLVHSRFRGHERRGWRESFLSRQACVAGADRIIVATQVVEAGVDVSATAMVTQLAPWPSLVQRFGRAARYGGVAQVTVVDRQLDEKNALPYAAPELDAALQALSDMQDVSLSNLEELEAHLALRNPDLLSRLYPYEPLHVLTRRQHDELFDTDPDLTGADLDVSRFIREGDERDVLVWWYPAERFGANGPDKSLQPTRDDLCRVGLRPAQDFLMRAAEDGAVWRWDYLDGAYRKLRANEKRLVYPGQTFLVDGGWGGYSLEVGFTGDRRGPKDPIIDAPHDDDALEPTTEADLAQDDERLSRKDAYRTIATHGRETGERVSALAAVLQLPSRFTAAVVLAGHLHDIGKAHGEFQGAIIGDERPARDDLAKAPAWRTPPYPQRPGFRHELASTLMAFELLRRVDPYHPALLGPHGALIEAGLLDSPSVDAEPAHADQLTDALKGMAAIDFQLMTYLICAHHGKVRAGWRCTPQDQETAVKSKMTAPLRGVADGDLVPPVAVAGPTATVQLPALRLDLSLSRIGVSPRYGASWSERVNDLLETFGPHTLAFLETLIRTADVRASAECNEDDPLLARRGDA